MFHSHSSQRFSRPFSRPVPGSACTGCADEQPKHRAKGKVAASDTVLGHRSNPYPRSVKTIYIYSTYSTKIYTFSLYHIQISLWDIIHHMINNCPPSFDYISDIITTQGICICIYIYILHEISTLGSLQEWLWSHPQLGWRRRWATPSQVLKRQPLNILKFSGSQID